MGLSFTGDGRYVGWSSLFDLHSIETLEASERLPRAKNRKYVNVEGGSDINSYLEEIFNIESQLYQQEEQINNTELRVARINAYNKLIRELNKITEHTEDGRYIANWDQKYNSIMNIVFLHESTKIPVTLSEDSNKNFISSHIQNTVQNLRNMIAAYSPIQMEDLRAASESSPKGEQATRLTLFNPLAKMVMQRQNIIGKQVIGIAANGEKVSFMWHYWLNDTLKKAKDQADLKYIEFSFTSKRIHGLKNGTPSEITIETLPEVNYENISDKAIAFYFKNKKKLTGNITVDLMISQVLSAATDNAKELILDKINCGDNFAQIYLFLITLGFDIEDIVKFMTSPVITFIDKVTNQNIFTDQYFSIEQAIELVNSQYDENYINKYMSSSDITQYKYFLEQSLKQNINPFVEGTELYNRANQVIKQNNQQALSLLVEDSIKMLKEGNVSQLKNVFPEGSKYKQSSIAFENYKYSIESIENLKDFSGYSKEDIQQDIAELQLIRAGAKEFSSAARLLGINQGIKTDKASLNSYLQAMQDIYKDVSEKSGGEDLDTYKYLSDEQYRREIIDKYNDGKVCLNVFAMLDQIPQYKSAYKLLKLVLDVDNNLTVKSKIFNESFNELKKRGYKYISEQYQKNMLRAIDNLLIYNYITSSVNIKVPYSKGITILDKFQREVEAKQDGFITLDSYDGIAQFKHYFENVLIPGLRQGTIYDDNNSQIGRSNDFIQSLIRGRDKDTPIYKCSLDMLTAGNNENSKKQFETYVKGLDQLQKHKINGTKVSDLFVLYNLIINKNNYGSDRLTSLFKSFSQSDNNGMFRYLNWIGKTDYSQADINYILEDIMLTASPIVTSTTGQRDPSVLLKGEDGSLTLMVKEGEYVPFEYKFITPLNNEDLATKMQRFQNYQKYYTLGGGYNVYLDNIIFNIKTVNRDALVSLKELVKKGVLSVRKICK